MAAVRQTVTHDGRVSVVAATLRAVLRHAALDRLPHAASSLSQRLPRLLGELRRALGCALRCGRQTIVAMPGRARAGPSRPTGLVRGRPSRPLRRSLGALLVPACRSRALPVARAFEPLVLGVTRSLVPLGFRAVATWRADLRLTALLLPPLRMLALRLLALRMLALRVLALRVLALRLRLVR